MASRSAAGPSARESLLALLILLVPAASVAPVAAQAGAAAQAQSSAGYALPVAAPARFQVNCAPCHGARGEGGIGPQLAGRALAAQAIATRVRQGGLVMPAFPPQQLTDAALQDLESYVGSLAAPPAAELLPAPRATAAGAPFFQQKCLVCHGAEARGGMVGPGILNTSLAFPRFMTQIRHGGGLMPPFAADQLSDAQVQAVYAYLHPPLPRPDPGTVYALPAVPDYAADFLFVLAALALLAQAASERRRRLNARLRVQEELVRARLPLEEGGVMVRVY